MAIYPTHEQLQAFLDAPDDGPVVMVNLLHFKSRADPPMDHLTGAEATMEYSRAMKTFVERHGASYVLAGSIDGQLIGEGGEQFDFIGIMRYPDRATYLKLAGDPEVAATIGKHREAGLESQWLFAVNEITS
jgi:uncharacterized protein (DUF1330 family)